MQALLLCPQYNSSQITGPVKRALQIKRLLEALGYSVTIACKNPPDESFIYHHGSKFNNLLTKCALIYADAFHMASFRINSRTTAMKLVDLYIPFFIEHKFSLPARYSGAELQDRFQLDQVYLTESLSKGDLFLAAGQRQIDLYTGLLSLFDNCYNLDFPIVDLPFYLEPNSTPEKSKNKSHIAWVGGAWHWFDMKSIIKPIEKWISRDLDNKFSFMGISHPSHAALHDSEQVSLAYKLAQQYPNQIEIIPWMQYEDYCSRLRDLDAAIILGHQGTESRFSIRTRFTELLERQIPIFCNDGDYFSDWIKKHQLGVIVTPDNLSEKLDSFLSGKLKLYPSYEDLFQSHSFDSILKKFNDLLKTGQEKGNSVNHPYVNLRVKKFYFVKRKLRQIFRDIFKNN